MQQNNKEIKNIIQNYCLIGLGNEYIPMLPSQRRFLTSIQLYEVKCSDFDLDVNVDWLDILGNKKLFLLCRYCEPNKDPIINIKFLDASVKDGAIQFNYNYNLCPIMSQQDVMKSVNISAWDKEKNRQHFDMSPYIVENFQKGQDLSYVLCYTRKSKSEYRPIINLRLDDYYSEDPFPDIVQFNDLSKKQIIIIRQKPPIEQQYTPSMLDLYPFNYKESSKQKHKNMVNNAELLCKICLPEGITATQSHEPITYYQIMKTQSAQPIYVYCLRFYEPLDTKQKLFFGNVALYLPKVIVFISSHFFTNQFSQLLTDIYSQREQIQVETLIVRLMDSLKYLNNLTDSPLKVQFPNQSLIFYETPNYPSCSLSALTYIFQKIKLENLLMLYSAVLTERRIRLCSSNIQEPGYTIEALQAFLYPMQYMKTAVCYLNIDNGVLLQTPDVYIIGVKENIDQPPCEYEGVKFILDKNVTYYVKPPPEFPLALAKELKKGLEPFIMKNQITEEDALKIRDCFFKVNLKLLKNYNNYDVKNPEWSQGFREMKQRKYPAKKFWKKFSKTQLLTYFISDIKSDVQAYLNTCFQKKNKNKVFVECKPPDNIYTVNITDLIQLQDRPYLHFPRLTPYNLLKTKQNAVQEQIYRMWFQMISMITLDHFFYQLADLLHKENPQMEIYPQENRQIEISQYDGINNKQFYLQNECPLCKRKITLQEILHKMPSTYLRKTIRCSKKVGCGTYFVPKMLIYETGLIDLINPHILQYKLHQLQIFDQQFTNKDEFWNFAVYFRLFSLPLPFVNQNEESIFCYNELERRKQGIKSSMQEAIEKLERDKQVKTLQIKFPIKQ